MLMLMQRLMMLLVGLCLLLGLAALLLLFILGSSIFEPDINFVLWNLALLSRLLSGDKVRVGVLAVDVLQNGDLLRGINHSRPLVLIRKRIEIESIKRRVKVDVL